MPHEQLLSPPSHSTKQYNLCLVDLPSTWRYRLTSSQENLACLSSLDHLIGSFLVTLCLGCVEFVGVLAETCCGHALFMEIQCITWNGTVNAVQYNCTTRMEWELSLTGHIYTVCGIFSWISLASHSRKYFSLECYIMGTCGAYTCAIEICKWAGPNEILWQSQTLIIGEFEQTLEL